MLTIVVAATNSNINHDIDATDHCPGILLLMLLIVVAVAKLITALLCFTDTATTNSRRDKLAGDISQKWIVMLLMLMLVTIVNTITPLGIAVNVTVTNININHAVGNSADRGHINDDTCALILLRCHGDSDQKQTHTGWCY
jgi:uncharacterized membrane protein